MSPPSLTSRSAKSSEPRLTRTFTVLTWSTRSLPCTLTLVDVLDVSHCGWSPGFLVYQSKSHVFPSLLPVHRHDTSLLDLLLAIDHRLRAPHLHTTSQETCHMTQLMPMVRYQLNLGRGSRRQSLITNRSTRAHFNLVFA